MSYDTWLQSDAAFEHFHGLDVPTEEEEEREELRVEAEIDRIVEDEYRWRREHYEDPEIIEGRELERQWRDDKLKEKGL